MCRSKLTSPIETPVGADPSAHVPGHGQSAGCNPTWLVMNQCVGGIHTALEAEHPVVQTSEQRPQPRSLRLADGGGRRDLTGRAGPLVGARKRRRRRCRRSSQARSLASRRPRSARRGQKPSRSRSWSPAADGRLGTGMCVR